MKVKICGLSDPAHVDTAVGAGADYVGFVFYGPSPRNVSIETAAALADRARGRTRIVALVVDPDDGLVDDICRHVKPDLFQAHGSESPERISQISRRTGVPVIKAVKIRDSDSVSTAEQYRESADMILFDTLPPDQLSGTLPGGNGVAFDWKLLKPAGAPDRFMLSGGLDAGNVAEAIRISNAPIVDVSSGVEISPGVKDATKIVKFIEAVKACG